MSKPFTAAAPIRPQLHVPALSINQVLPWLIFAGLLLLLALYFLSSEQGATYLIPGNAVHEWLHDGRHLLGYPCH